MKYDICILGAGILGTTLAHNLRNKHSVCVIDTQSEPGLVQTSVNSSVIHSGIYCTPDQNILNFCLEGKDKMKHFCEKHHIKHRKCGKKILGNINAMNTLIDRCNDYNIKYIMSYDHIFLPDVFLMDYKELTNFLYYNSCDKVDYLFGAKPIFEDGKIKLHNKTIEYDFLVNLTGTHAIEIYRQFSDDFSYTVCEIEGYIHKYNAVNIPQWLHAPMIYRFTDEHLPFLGPHITPMLEPGFKLGPNVEVIKSTV